MFKWLSSLAREGRRGFLKRPRLAKNRELRLLQLITKPYRNTDKRKVMKQFKVYWNNTVEINLVADFDTLDEAKQYCTDNTKGYGEVGDNDNCWEGRSNNFHYEVYDGDKEILDEDGDVVDFNEPVYETKQFYCD